MSLIDSMSVVDNMFLGRELTRGATARQWTDRGAELRKAREFCEQLDLDIDLSRPVEDYSLSVKNRIEIAKALAFDARIFIMDEPTSALSRPEVDKLFAIVGQLKARGCGIVYITHRMEEIYRIADRITVLRDGRHVGTAPAGDLAGGGADPLDDRPRAEPALPGARDPPSAPSGCEVGALGAEARGTLEREAIVAGPGGLPLRPRRRDRRARRPAGLGQQRAAPRASSARTASCPRAGCSIDGRAIRDPARPADRCSRASPT